MPMNLSATCSPGPAISRRELEFMIYLTGIIEFIGITNEIINVKSILGHRRLPRTLSFP